jgi:hypothetical protein
MDPVFFERYFGHVSVWTNQLRQQPRVARRMARAVVAAALAHPERTTELAPLLPPLVGAAAVGVKSRVALNRLALMLDEIAVEHLPLPERWRWGRFLRAHARAAHLAQLEWIGGSATTDVAPRPFDRWAIEDLGPNAVTGVHGLEEQCGRRFRWTEPVVMVRLAASDGGHELQIETGGIRGDPLASVIAVVVDGRVLPAGLVTSDRDGTLVLRLPSPWSAAARDGVVIVCSPLAPARAGSSDSRLLGLPIISIACVPLGTRAPASMAAA